MHTREPVTVFRRGRHELSPLRHPSRGKGFTGSFIALLALLLALGQSTSAFGWRCDRRYWRDVEDEMRRMATIRKSEQTKETARRTAPIEQPPPEEQVRQRLTLINRQIQKLEGDRKKIVDEGANGGEVAALDERIEKLRREAEGWKRLLGVSTD